MAHDRPKSYSRMVTLKSVVRCRMMVVVDKVQATIESGRVGDLNGEIAEGVLLIERHQIPERTGKLTEE